MMSLSKEDNPKMAAVGQRGTQQDRPKVDEKQENAAGKSCPNAGISAKSDGNVSS